MLLLMTALLLSMYTDLCCEHLQLLFLIYCIVHGVLCDTLGVALSVQDEGLHSTGVQHGYAFYGHLYVIGQLERNVVGNYN